MSKKAILQAAVKGTVSVIRKATLKLQSLSSASSGNEWEAVLILAVENGHDKIVEILLKKGVDPNTRNERRETVLMLACSRGFLSTAELLLRFDADINASCEQEVTSLMVACTKGFLKIVKVLTKSCADLCATNLSGRTPLMCACDGELDNVKIVCHLITKNKDIVNECDNEKRTALMLAVLRNHEQSVRMLFENGADVNKIDVMKQTALIMAFEKGLSQTQTVQFMMDKAVDINTDVKAEKDCPFKIALYYACAEGNDAVAKILFERLKTAENEVYLCLLSAIEFNFEWSPVRIVCKKNNAKLLDMILIFFFTQYESKYVEDLEFDRKSFVKYLLEVCELGHIECLKVFIQYGVLDKPPDKRYSGLTCLILMAACRAGHLDIVKLLLKQPGVNMEAIDRLKINRQYYTGTALSCASENGYSDIVRLLLKKCPAAVDVSVNSRISGFGMTPLMLACKNGHLKVVRNLIHFSADTERKNRRGRTALMMACKRGSLKIVNLLLTAGADVNIKDKRNRSALNLACLYRHVKVVETLVKNGVEINAEDWPNVLVFAGVSENPTIIGFVADLEKDSVRKFGEKALAHSKIKYSVLGLLKALCVNPDACKNKNGLNRLFMEACQSGKDDLVELLLKDSRVEVNQCGEGGKTALMVALAKPYYSLNNVSNLLIQHRADVNVQSLSGTTVLDILFDPNIRRMEQFNPKSLTICYLLSAGLKVDYTTKVKPDVTFFLYLCIEGIPRMVELLSERGTNWNIPIKDTKESLMEMSPLSCALRYWNFKIAPQLIKNGADVNVFDERGMTPLHHACMWHDEKLFALVMERNPKIIEAQDMHQKTALMYACQNGYEDFAKELIEKTQNINLTNFKTTPLLLAVWHGCASIVRMLLEKGVRLEDKDTDSGSTALIWASSKCGPSTNESIEIVEMLLHYGANVKAVDNDNSSALHYAVNRGHDDIAELLIGHGADFHHIRRRREPSFTLLMAACLEENTKMVELLINKGANLKERNELQEGRTAMMYACSASESASATQIVELLIAADVRTIQDCDKYNHTTLMCAVNAENMPVIELLTHHRENSVHRQTLVNRRIKNSKITALMLAAEKGNVEIAAHLIKTCGAQLNARDNSGKSALMYCCKHDCPEVAELLISLGANINLQDKEKRYSALMYACHFNRTDIVESLLECKNINVDQCNDDLETALTMACIGGDCKSAQLLIAKGAKLDGVDSEGKVPLAHACSNGCDSLVDILLEAGSDPLFVNEEGDSVLIYASGGANPKVVEKILCYGGDVNHQNKKGLTALMSASKRSFYSGHKLIEGCVGVVKLLLQPKWGVAIDVQDENGFTALLHASKNYNDQRVELLLKAGANAKLCGSLDQGITTTTAFSLFCNSWFEEGVQMLLEPSSKIVSFSDFVDETKMSCSRRAEMLFLQQDLDINIRDRQGMTALMWVARNSNQGHGSLTLAECDTEEEKNSLYQRLVEKGADHDLLRNPISRQTVFSLAMMYDSSVVLEQMLKNGKLMEDGQLKLVHRQGDSFRIYSESSVKLALAYGVFEWRWCNKSWSCLKSYALIEIGCTAMYKGFCPGNGAPMKFEGANINMSPFLQALLLCNKSFVDLFVDNLYFTMWDFNFLREKGDFIKCLVPHTLRPVVNKFNSEIFSLSKLCLLTISQSIADAGVPTERPKRVDALNLPEMMKQVLKFDNLSAKQRVEFEEKVQSGFDFDDNDDSNSDRYDPALWRDVWYAPDDCLCFKCGL